MTDEAQQLKRIADKLDTIDTELFVVIVLLIFSVVVMLMKVAVG